MYVCYVFRTLLSSSVKEHLHLSYLRKETSHFLPSQPRHLATPGYPHITLRVRVLTIERIIGVNFSVLFIHFN